MSKLISYYAKTLFRKSSNLILPIMTLLLVVVLRLIFNSSSTTVTFIKDVSKTLFFLRESFLIQAVYFVSSLLFISGIVGFLFKKGTEQNVDILVLTKPYSKKEIIFSKLIVLFTSILCLHLFFFLIEFGSSFISTSSAKEILLSSTSILVGGIVISTIFTSALMFLSQFINSKRIIYVTSATAILVPAISIFLSFVGNTEMKSARKYSYLNDRTQLNLDLTNTDGEYVQNKEMKDIIDTPYETLVYFDPWYHLSGLYSLFSKNNNSHINWVQGKESVNGVIQIGSSKYHILYSDFSKTKDIGLNRADIISNIMSNSEYVNKIKSLSTKISSLSFEGQMLLSTWMLDRGTRDTEAADISSRIDEIKLLSTIDLIHNFEFTSSKASYDLLSQLSETGDIKLSSSLSDSYSQIHEVGQNFILLKESTKVDVFVAKDYLNKNYMFIFWLCISLLMFGLCFKFELKKEILS